MQLFPYDCLLHGENGRQWRQYVTLVKDNILHGTRSSTFWHLTCSWDAFLIFYMFAYVQTLADLRKPEQKIPTRQSQFLPFCMHILMQKR